MLGLCFFVSVTVNTTCLSVVLAVAALALTADEAVYPRPEVSRPRNISASMWSELPQLTLAKSLIVYLPRVNVNPTP